MTNITGTLQEDVRIFIITSRENVLKMLNFLGKLCREDQNKYFTPSNFFPKIVTFMR